MTPLEASEIFEYWRSSPPEHEMLRTLVQTYTNWEPKSEHPRTAEEHQESLEARWKAGAMNAKQIFEATGGSPVSLN